MDVKIGRRRRRRRRGGGRDTDRRNITINYKRSRMAKSKEKKTKGSNCKGLYTLI